MATSGFLEVPQEVLNIVISYLQVADKSCLKLSWTCSRLREYVLQADVAWESIDCSRFLSTADDLELCSSWPSNSLVSRLTSINLTGLERIRGYALARLFVDLSVNGLKTNANHPALTDGVTNDHHVLNQESSSSLEAAATSSLSASITSPSHFRIKERGGGAAAGTGGPVLSSHLNASIKQYLSSIPTMIDQGVPIAKKLTNLDVSMCSLLEPDLLVASLHGCPNLLQL
jgi:hypothetical protein